MTITIPESVRYSNRDYDVGTVIELDDSKKGDIDNHPLFILMLQFIASPFSDENFDDVEDNLKYFLNPGFMAKIAEQDKDVIFNEEEYREHVNYAWNELQKLSTEELLLKLRQYVGNYDQITRLLDSGLLDEGKGVKIQEINEEIPTDHLLSAHTKGIESKKIFQAADKKARYEPALDHVNDFITMQVNELDPTKISLPRSRNPMTVNLKSYIIDIDFEELFNKLFMDAGINPMPLSGGQKEEPSTVRSRTSTNDTDAALQEALSRAKKVKKSLESILKQDDEDDFDYSQIREYKPHSQYQLNDEAQDILNQINLKIEWNRLLKVGEFKYDDGFLSGDLDALEIMEQMKEGQLRETGRLADEMLDMGVLTQEAYDKLMNEGKVPGRRTFNKRERQLIESVVNFKSQLNPPVGRTEFEQAIYTKQVASNLRVKKDKLMPVLHSEKTGKDFFKNDSWKTPDNVEIDLQNGARNSIKLKRMLDLALVPKEVGILRISLVATHATDDEKQARMQMIQEEEDEDIVANSKYLLDKVYDVFKLDNVEYIVKTKYSFKDWVERKPEYRSMAGERSKAKKYKFREYKRPRHGLRGRLDEGGQPTHINVKSNTILYYIKKQVSELKRVM